MPRARALIVLAPLALAVACAPARSPTPSVSTAPREAEVRAVETTGRTGLRVLGLTQGTIRACSGAYEPPTRASPSRTTELACTGGVTGTATVGPDARGGRSVRWQLDTGEAGRVLL